MAILGLWLSFRQVLLFPEDSAVTFEHLWFLNFMQNIKKLRVNPEKNAVIKSGHTHRQTDPNSKSSHKGWAQK